MNFKVYIIIMLLLDKIMLILDKEGIDEMLCNLNCIKIRGGNSYCFYKKKLNNLIICCKSFKW